MLVLISGPTLRGGAPTVVGPCCSAHTRRMEETFEILQVGEGPVAEALARMTDVLGWTTTSATTLDGVEAALPL